MMTLLDWVERFLNEERPISVLLEPETVQAQAVAATNFYAGYAVLEANLAIEPPFPDIDVNVDISVSEWAVIRTLFMLYVERETALQLEASRCKGVDVFGRSVSEITQDITQYEVELPHRAFYQPVLTV